MDALVAILAMASAEMRSLIFRTVPFVSLDKGAIFTLSGLLIYLGVVFIFKPLYTDVDKRRHEKRLSQIGREEGLPVVEIKSRAVLNFDYVLTLVMAVVSVLSFFYLFYPTYFDHIESTIAGLGRVMNAATALYPYPDVYPYHGIIYGPALAEIQGLFRNPNLSPILASKLPGVLALLTWTIFLFTTIKSQAAKGYILFVIPFTFLLFWNRAEPFFLVLIFLSIASVKYVRSKDVLLPIALGVFMGAASAFKIHGMLYLLPISLVAMPAGTAKRRWFFLIPLAAFLSYVAFFIPRNVSLFGSFDYLLISSKHGISLDTLYHNFVYLGFLFVPFLFFRKRIVELERYDQIKLILVAGIESTVAVIGAKTGAGSYHLLPFIAVNAYLIDHYLVKNAEDFPSSLRAMYMIMLFPCFVSLYGLEESMSYNWRVASMGQAEVLAADQRYPGIVMGITDEVEFPLIFLRSALRAQQVDYSVFMDLNHSGYGDDTFVKDLESCSIKYLLMPGHGAPFSIKNWYQGTPLLSDGLRQAFVGHFQKIASGENFSIYECGPNAASL